MFRILKNGRRIKLRRHKHSLMISLVFFVFLVLLVTSILTTCVFVGMVASGILPNFSIARFAFQIFAMMLSILFIGTIFTALIGKLPLRPIHILINATQEIADGNFDVRIPTPRGPSEFQCLVESFNKMAEKLGSIETLRNDFVGNVSHEFKTPVASIKGFAKLLKKEDLPEKERQEYLDIIITESERLAQLSGNMLLLSRLEKEEAFTDCNTFALDEQLRQSIVLLNPIWEKKNIVFDIDLDDMEIHASEEMLKHVWLNLLQNAIKFSKEGGCIHIRNKSDETQHEIEISDEGVGMDNETKERLFEKFYQADKSRMTEGNGLGLALVSKIVKMSGGKIVVESEPEKGSSFHISLPKGL